MLEKKRGRTIALQHNALRAWLTAERWAKKSLQIYAMKPQIKLVIRAALIAVAFLIPLSMLRAVTEAERAKIEAEVIKLLDDYQDAWNKRDVVAWELTYHFPHYRLAGGTMTVLDRPGLQDLSKFYSARPDWHHSASDHRRIIHLSEDKVHIDTKFTRYRADGSKIETFESLYIVTKENGRWGVKMRSSFAQNFSK